MATLPTAGSMITNQNNYYNTLSGNARDVSDEISASRNEAVNAYIDAMNNSYAGAISNMQNATNTGISALNQQYQKAYDVNEINRLIAQRQLAEQMENMGLTNSGLNRTQMAALETQKANANASALQQKNAAANALRQQLNDYLANIETQKLQNAANARYNAANANASTLENLLGNAQNNAASMAQTQYGAQSSWAEMLAGQDFTAQQNALNRQHELNVAQENAKAAQIQADREAQQRYNNIIVSAQEKYGDLKDETALDNYLKKQVALGYLTTDQADQIAYGIIEDNNLGYKVSDGQVIPIGNVKFIDWPGGEPLGDAGRYKRVDVAGGRRTVWKKV